MALRSGLLFSAHKSRLPLLWLQCCPIRGKQTHFGYTMVDEQEKPNRVYDVFENVAEKYDIMNDAMSCGIHRLWKDCFVRQLHPCSNMHVLDAAGGTGDIAFRIWAQSRQNGPNGPCKVTVTDINEPMLRVGMAKAKSFDADGLSWLRADAEQLPFKMCTFDAYTIAFGIRNCTHIDRVLSEAYRVLKPGGRFLCLEFSQVDNRLLSSIYDWYSFNIIPVLGRLIANDWSSYQYLVESIRKFPTQTAFATMIQEAGFANVSWTSWCAGIVAVHSGHKLPNTEAGPISSSSKQ